MRARITALACLSACMIVGRASRTATAQELDNRLYSAVQHRMNCPVDKPGCLPDPDAPPRPSSTPPPLPPGARTVLIDKETVLAWTQLIFASISGQISTYASDGIVIREPLPSVCSHIANAAVRACQSNCLGLPAQGIQKCRADCLNNFGDYVCGPRDVDVFYTSFIKAGVNTYGLDFEAPLDINAIRFSPPLDHISVFLTPLGLDVEFPATSRYPTFRASSVDINLTNMRIHPWIRFGVDAAGKIVANVEVNFYSNVDVLGVLGSIAQAILDWFGNSSIEAGVNARIAIAATELLARHEVAAGLGSSYSALIQQRIGHVSRFVQLTFTWDGLEVSYLP